MKRLFSALIALSLVASTAITAFAAEVTFKGATDKEKYQPGDTVVVSVETVGDPFAAATLELKFDKTQFTYVGAENKGAGTPSAITPANRANGFSRVVFGATDNIQGTIKIDFTFTVNEGLADGTYNLPFGANGAIKDDWGTELAVTNIEIPIVIGKDAPVDDKTHAVIDKTPCDTIPAVNGFYSKGFKVDITPNDDTITKVAYALACKDKTSLEKASGAWEGLTLTGKTPISFAINVINIPDTIVAEDITNNWTVDVTVAE